MNLSRAFPCFSIGFGICYLASMYYHPMFTMFTYSPRLGTWFTGVPALGTSAPGMFWWSWLTTGLIGGIVLGGIALVTPETIRQKAWSGWVWVVPVALTVILAYIERTWFGYK